MKNATGFSGPRIPGMGMNSPHGNQFKMNIDIMSLDNVKCIECENELFILNAYIKMINPLQSPDGKWAHAVAQWWACSHCGRKFDPTEWVEKQKEENKEVMKNAQAPILVGSGIADK